MNKVYVSKKLREMEWVEERLAKLDMSSLKERLKKRIRKFKRCKFRVCGRVLDVGAGSGVDLLAMFSINPEIEAVGVDFCRGALKFAKAILPRKASHLVLADAAHLPFREATFNAINVSFMLHHHPYRVLKQIIRKLALLLKTNGVMLIEEPSVWSESEAFHEEIESLESEFEIHLKIRHEVPSRLRAYLYDLIPLFRYGTAYPSLLKMVVGECGLKIESSHMRREKAHIDYAKFLEDLREKIRKSKIPNYEKAYLMEKVDAMFFKLKIVRLADHKADHKHVVFKLKRQT